MGQEYVRIQEIRGGANYSGRVLLYDEGKDSVVKWEKEFESAGNLVLVDTVRTLPGSKAIQFDYTAPVSDADKNTMYKRLDYPQSDKIKLSFYLNWNLVTGYIPYFLLSIGLADGSTYWHLAVRKKFANTAWEWESSDGVWSVVNNSTHKIGANTWIKVEIILDLINKKVDLLRISNFLVPVSDVLFLDYGGREAKYFDVVIGMIMVGTSQQEIFIQNILVEEV